MKPTTENIGPLRQKTLRVAKVLEHNLGLPKPTAKKVPPLDMLIATILSQNTNDKNSHRAYVRLRTTFPAWEAVLDAPTRKIESVIRPGGMANQKSARIKKLLKTLHKKFGNLSLNFLKRKSDQEIFDILLPMDGVGVKTAACVLLFSLGRDVFPVDTHIHRLCRRLALVPDSRSPEETFERMKKLVPKSKVYSFHTNLIRFGRKVCKSNRPLCGECPLFKECAFKEKSVFADRQSETLSDKNFSFMLLDNV